MAKRTKQLWADERGQDLIEYALLSALVCTGAVVLIPGGVFGAMTHIYSRVNSVLARYGG